MDRVEWICDDCSASLASSRALRDHYRHVHKFLVQDEGARTRVHRTPQLNEMAHEGGEDVVMSDEIEAEDTGDLQVAAVCNGANNENVNVQKRLRSAILEMSSTLTGRLKVTDKALNFLFKSLEGMEKIREEGRGRGEVVLPPYDEFRTTYKRRKVMVNEAGLVEPLKVEIGSAIAKDSRSGRFRRIPVHGYVVPVIQTMKLLLKHPEIVGIARKIFSSSCKAQKKSTL